MDESFSLPVSYGGAQKEYASRLSIQGYTHRFSVMVEETEVIYERDEEGGYRALLAHPEDTSQKCPELGLLEAIGQQIRSIVE